jgi:uncharacterized protein YbaP (TraB family)
MSSRVDDIHGQSVGSTAFASVGRLGRFLKFIIERWRSTARSARHWIVACAAVGAGYDVSAQTPPAEETIDPIEEITIVGRYPGPPLWRVSRGEHVLYIFGELAPVPKGLDWDPRNVERVLENAQVVIGAPRVNATTLNPIRLFRLFRAARRLSRSPEGTTLADALPPELYTRYTTLRARYLPRDDDDEDLRPALAALRVYNAALDEVGLTSTSGVGRKVERLMRRSKAEESEILVETEPEEVLDALAKVTPEAELMCFATVMTSVETDLQGMKERANAWALGDVAALERFEYPDSRGDCLAMLFSSADLAELRDQLYADWLGEAERALTEHERSFSILPMRELIADDGLLAQLAARGYTVTRP